MRYKKLAAIVIASAALATTLTGCGANGNNAATRLINQVTDGVDAQIDKDGNQIKLTNIHIALNTDGTASLIAYIVNQANVDEALVAVAIGQTNLKISPIPALQNKPIIFGGDSANAKAELPNSGLIAGNRIPVSFFFGRAGEVTVDALIVNA